MRSDRVKLADVRRGQYEGLKAEIGHNGRHPDFGPARMHSRAGAVAVGARPFLIAWNINLDSDDVELAKRIARRVRESGGGLPRVQANGFRVEELFDFNRVTTPGWWWNGKVLRRRHFSRVQLKLLNLNVWWIRRLDALLPWSGTSLIAVARRP